MLVVPVGRGSAQINQGAGKQGGAHSLYNGVSLERPSVYKPRRSKNARWTASSPRRRQVVPHVSRHIPKERENGGGCLPPQATLRITSGMVAGVDAVVYSVIDTSDLWGARHATFISVGVP